MIFYRFIIRIVEFTSNSLLYLNNTFSIEFFFLAKVDLESELVRHFLIEPCKKGVRLKGSNEEPAFSSLMALVYQHSLTKMALPIPLVLPEFGEF